MSLSTTAALAIFRAATPAQQAAWTTAYGTALNSVTFTTGQPVRGGSKAGPASEMMAAELMLARS